MTLPAWTSARIAMSGLRAAIIGGLFIIVLLAAAVQTLRLEGLKVRPFKTTGWIEKARTYKSERDSERTAHRKTKDDYRTAQEKAQRLETARLERVRTQQEEITDAIQRNYRARLGKLDARAQRLRDELRARSQPDGSSADQRSTAVRSTTGRADAAPGDHRLPPYQGENTNAGSLDRSPQEQLERDIVATQQAIQLDALIDWVERQTAVDPNAEPD
ncbi:hypothetical protein [Alteriqipengyuania lutimaris]|uniref:Uncharacterized protein n=1 Tax=Alteriqipengyuania lutimaris TaxID=1538146 RepID=A0A395LQP1_9SPHN|nr:hypothetical protein [Alteriqipengyuania lutimaris]MBB3034070.1 hypothetical protein [Alteriqipengyuania lutimaris]RDS76990.1 hypothetical protein DL238_04790 [Alteriqipengyuania lutimaris]